MVPLGAKHDWFCVRRRAHAGRESLRIGVNLLEGVEMDRHDPLRSQQLHGVDGFLDAHREVVADGKTREVER